MKQTVQACIYFQMLLCCSQEVEELEYMVLLDDIGLPLDPNFW